MIFYLNLNILILTKWKTTFETTLEAKFAWFQQFDSLYYPVSQLKVENQTFVIV